jgi:uncharacterized protein
MTETLNLDSLLGALTVGSEAVINSPHEWSDYLVNVPGADGFLWQLEKEWFPAEPPSPLAELVMEKVYDQMSAWNSGYPNLWSHTLRVAGYALQIAPDAGVTAEQAFMVAFLHDVGKFDEMRTGVAHEEIAAEMTYRLLEKQLPRNIVSSIAMAVGKTGRGSEDMVRLLHDADKLDKIGASGIVRRVSQTVTLPNAFYALGRVATDLDRFPSMKHPTAQRIADRKRTYTELILNLRETLPEPA